MPLFCSDRDLLILEPRVFAEAFWNAQRLSAGTEGLFSGTSFTADGGSLASAGIQGGMVLCTYVSQSSEGMGYEILSVKGDNTLIISVPRASVDDPPVAPVVAPGPTQWQVLTFAPQIAAASATLAERLRNVSESAGIRQAGFADSAQLRTVAACLSLAGIFAAAAETNDDSDGRWTKSCSYMNLYRSSLLNLRLACDIDGDGVAEETRTLANVRLRRL